MEFSSVLIDKLHKLDVDDDLKNLINEYIEKTKNEKGLSMVLIRGNYHYILDNIKKDELKDELRKLLAHTNKSKSRTNNQKII